MPHEPDRPGPPDPILASDAEREHSVAMLRDAAAEGRLTLDEFSERVGLAQAARTDHELAQLTRDLPAARTRALDAPAIAPRHHAIDTVGAARRLGAGGER